MKQKKKSATENDTCICNVQIHQFRVQIKLNLNHCANDGALSARAPCELQTDKFAVNDILFLLFEIRSDCFSSSFCFFHVLNWSDRVINEPISNKYVGEK